MNTLEFVWPFKVNDAWLVNLVSYSLCVSMFLAFLVLSSGVTAPYGRYSKVKSFGISWGYMIDGKVAWVVQECPSLFLPMIFYIVGPTEIKDRLVNRLLLCYFMLHYLNRVIIYPLRIRGGKPTPFYVALSAFLFTLCNGYIQGRYLTAIYAFEDYYFTSIRFRIGSILFWLGMAINW